MLFMSTDLKIAEESWTALEDGTLDTMSTNAALVISDAANYPDLVAEAAALTTAANKYHISYSRYAAYGGSDHSDLMEADKLALYAAHANAASKLEMTDNGNKEYLTLPGYRTDEKLASRFSFAAVPAPKFQKVESNTKRGRVKFILKAKIPREVKAIIGKYSTDNGATWHNGIMELNLRFVLDDQPSGQGVLYQFMFQATNGRKSDWSGSHYVDVY